MAKFTPTAFGKYFLIERLAIGGMAEIYKAKTFGVDGFEKLLAIKKILAHCSADKDFIHMLIDEAKLSVLLSHTNIVQVYDLGKVGDDYFISMEYIDGFNLRQVMSRGQETTQKIPESMIVYMMSEVCKGLDYAHHRRDSHNNPLAIVHRDISPQNILLSFEGEVKIVDFGIAKAAMNMSQTMAGILKGKVSYMSPEQALGKPVDSKTDIFSVGAVFYELLTGKKLFTGETQLEVLKKIRSIRITEDYLKDDVPEPLRPMLARALAYRPQDRYENAGDFQIGLTRYLYSSYQDFSPRQLSTFMRTWFTEELHNRKEKSIQESEALDSKTQSLLLSAQEQENIVHRGGTGDVLPASDTRTTKPGEAITATVLPSGAMQPGVTHPGVPTITEHKAATRRQSLQWVIAALLLLLALTAGLYVYKVYYQGMGAPIEADVSGTLNVSSTPPGAQIYLNNRATELSTPATLSNLDLYIGHKISLRKERYQSWENIVTLVNDKPLRLDAELAAIPYGQVVIETLPAGADLFLNGEATPHKTPVTLDSLEVGKSYRLKVTKPTYVSQEKEFTISDETAVTWQVELKPLTGTAAIETSPRGAQIILNGKETGKSTPASFSELEIGKSYELLLRKTGYEDKRYSFAVENEQTRSISLTLDPIQAPPEAPKPEQKPAQKPSPPEKIVTKKPEVPIETPPSVAVGSPASLTLKSTPSDAVVYVNGIRMGKTPGTFEISPGKVELIVEKENLFPYRQTLTLGAGEKKKLAAIRLEALTGKVFINSIPSGATVYVDGDKTGNTPIRVSGVRKGKSYRIDVNYPGFKQWSKSIALDKDSLDIMAKLEKN